FDAAAIALEQRCQSAPDPEIDARPAVCRIGLPEIVALAVSHHFERELIVVAQKNRPLTAVRDRWRLPNDVADRKTIFGRNSHVHPRHEGEMERHLAFV